ncbi:MAG: DUF4870 family protein [Burkholderiales bacterium]
MATEPAVTRNLESDSRLVHILYLLHLLAPFTAWILAVVAIILGMARRDELRGTFLESHVAWLSRTFWWGLLWILVAGLATGLFILTIILAPLFWLPCLVLFCWYLYRVIRGWLRLNDGLAAD